MLFFFFWHPCDSDVGMFEVVLEVPKSFLIFLNSCFFILLWLNVYFFLLVQILDLSPGFLPFTVGSLYIFLYFTLCCPHFFFHLRLKSIMSMSILITSILNSASDRLAISSLSCILSEALICSLIWAIFFLSWHACYVVRGGALGVHQGRATHVAAL